MDKSVLSPGQLSPSRTACKVVEVYEKQVWALWQVGGWPQYSASHKVSQHPASHKVFQYSAFHKLSQQSFLDKDVPAVFS